MIINKSFDIPKVEFEANSHTYTLNGEPTLSVTNVISVKKDLYKYVNDYVLDLTRKRGNALHAYAALLFSFENLDEYEIDLKVIPYINTLRESIESIGLLHKSAIDTYTYFIEEPICCPKTRIAGTPDLIIFDMFAKICSIVELKSGLFGLANLQTAGYQHIIDNITKEEWKFRRYGIKLTERFDKKNVVKYDKILDEQVFTSCLNVAKYFDMINSKTA